MVSLLPNVTEILFALGAGEQVVGISDFCVDASEDEPPIPRLGRLGGFNVERILELGPDVVFYPPGYGEELDVLAGVGISCVPLRVQSLSDVRRVILDVGSRIERRAEAEMLVAKMDAEMAPSVSSFWQGKRVMVVVDRPDMGSGRINEVYLAGQDDFYSAILERLGAKNAYEDSLAYPLMSYEHIIGLEPDVIVEVARVPPQRMLSAADIGRDWDACSLLPAVQQKQVFVITNDYATIPGPRIGSLFLNLKQIGASCDARNSGR